MIDLFYKLPVKAQRFLGWRLRSLIKMPATVGQMLGYRQYSRLDVGQRKQWIFERTRAIAVYAQRKNPFYRRYYGEQGFDATQLRAFEELADIPIVNKDILRAAHDEWAQPGFGVRYANTGGTSGSPLQFCLSITQRAREAYYMDQIWKRQGCLPTSPRVTFRGGNIGPDAWEYDPLENAYKVNTYRPLAEISEELETLFSTSGIEYIHGYPSAIYQFALHCMKPEQARLRQLVLRHLKGILLASEYPAPQYRTAIETAFPVPSVSWYGHSEMTVLAAERDRAFVYEPFHSYGFCEAVAAPDGHTHLVGTCYDNRATPFIRYDTGDSVDVEESRDGLLLSFRMKEGRLGEFIVDRKGHPVSLTSLIFGRHHKAFERAEFVQISQVAAGQAIVYVTTPSSRAEEDIATWFDMTNVDVEFRYETRRKPFRSKMGKVPLLIPPP